MRLQEVASAPYLSKVNAALEVDMDIRGTLTIIVTRYDAVCILREAWDLVPKGVIINAWLKTDIISLPQRQDIKNLITACGNIKGPALDPQFGPITQNEAAAANERAVATRTRVSQ